MYNQENRLVSEKVARQLIILQLIQSIDRKSVMKFSISLCIGYIDYKKAFDSIENEAISKALRTIGIKETYVTGLEGHLYSSYWKCT